MAYDPVLNASSLKEAFALATQRGFNYGAARKLDIPDNREPEISFLLENIGAHAPAAGHLKGEIQLVAGFIYFTLVVGEERVDETMRHVGGEFFRSQRPQSSIDAYRGRSIRRQMEVGGAHLNHPGEEFGHA